MSQALNPLPPGTMPRGRRVYAVGDIHGRNDLLNRLLGRIQRDLGRWRGAVTLVFLGDYVDRGPESRAVIDTLLALARQADTRFLRGNHEQLVLDFLASPDVYPAWHRLGGGETLKSYGVAAPDLQKDSIAAGHAAFVRALPAEHRNFLLATLPSFSIGGYFLTHAGVRPGVDLSAQSARDLMWIRDEFLESEHDFGKVVVHGHSPVRRLGRIGSRIGLDTGAYASGRLTAAVLEGQDCRFLQT